MEENTKYLATWKEYCEQNEIDYEENSYLEPYWHVAQEKLFGFVIKLLI